MIEEIRNSSAGLGCGFFITLHRGTQREKYHHRRQPQPHRGGVYLPEKS